MKAHSVSRWIPNSLGGRIILGCGAAFLLVILAVIGSVWIEYRHPSGDMKRALLPVAQRVLTKPIVNAIGRQADVYIRAKAESIYMDTSLTLEQTITAFVDERVPLKYRRVYAYRLARVGSPECLAALRTVFQTAPPDDLADMLQLVGTTGNAALKPYLWPLLQNENEVVVAGAIRGLSLLGSDEVTATLAAILADDRKSNRLRGEAATGLGTLGTPAARDALLAQTGRLSPGELQTQIFTSLGQYEFADIAGAFKQYLNSGIPAERRVAAVEALSHSSIDAAPFLLALAGKDANAEVRASAAWAISTHHDLRDLGPALAELAVRETEADVRRRLYEALLPQAEIPAQPLWPVVLAEQDIAARVAGFNALGVAAKHGDAMEFDRQVVPELVQIATTPNSLNIQMRAVFALRRAQTPAALTALAAIASQAVPQVATAARNGLPKGS